MKKLIIVLLGVAAVGVLAVTAWLASMSHRRAAAVRQYEAQGFQMVKGCNGTAALNAGNQVRMLKRYLEDFADFSAKETNVFAQLRLALVVAQEKARVLNEDCRRRGHCETYPWTTNWAVVKRALDFEKPN
jgi:hypothetical protein